MRLRNATNRQIKRNFESFYGKNALTKKKAYSPYKQKFWGRRANMNATVRKGRKFKWVKGKCKTMERRKLANALRLLGKTRTAYWYKGYYAGIVTDKTNYEVSGDSFAFPHVGSVLVGVYKGLSVTAAALDADNTLQSNYLAVQGRINFCPYWPVNTMMSSGFLKDGAKTGAGGDTMERSFALLGDTTSLTGNYPKSCSLNKIDKDTVGVNQSDTWKPNAWTKCIIASWYVTFDFNNQTSKPVDVHVFLYKVKNDSIYVNGNNQSLRPERWEYQLLEQNNPTVIKKYGPAIDRLKAQHKLPNKFYIQLKRKTIRLGPDTDNPGMGLTARRKVGFSVKNMYKEYTKVGRYGPEEIPSGAEMFTQHLFDDYYLMIDTTYSGSNTSSVSFQCYKTVKYYLK